MTDDLFIKNLKYLAVFPALFAIVLFIDYLLPASIQYETVESQKLEKINLDKQTYIYVFNTQTSKRVIKIKPQLKIKDTIQILETPILNYPLSIIYRYNNDGDYDKQNMNGSLYPVYNWYPFSPITLLVLSILTIIIKREKNLIVISSIASNALFILLIFKLL
jgi:hypothetical protein